MSQPLPSGTHLNPKFSGVHINPNFKGKSETTPPQSNVHVNPNFKKNESQQSTSTSNIHVNPNFSNRALPPIPGSSLPQPPTPSSPKSKAKAHINPNFLDGKKAKAYEEAIKMAVEGKIHINPNFKPAAAKISPTSALEKENIKTPALQNIRKMKTPSASGFSSATKTLFKKIGQRKLVRVGGSSSKNNSKMADKSASQETPKQSRKFINKENTTSIINNHKKSNCNNANNLSLEGTYKVKTDRKIVKKQSPRFHTPFASSKKRKRQLNNSPTVVHKKRFKLVKVLNPFRVDRRIKKEQQQHQISNSRKILKRTLTPRRQGSSSSNHRVMIKKKSPLEMGASINSNAASCSNRKNASICSQKLVGGASEDISSNTNTPFMKKPVPPKPVRKTPVTRQPSKPPSTTLINVQGIKYTVSDNGRKLNRLSQVKEEESNSSTKKIAPSSTIQPPNPNLNESSILAKKLFIEGEEYIEDEPGILIRSRNSMTRQSINSAKQKSINTILKSQTRSKQYCMFYNKFGKCKKKEDGVCPYIHDPEKIAVCRKFLQQKCEKPNCLLSHKVAPEKMPTCKFFLEGMCTRDPCPYRHVKVNDAAEVCPDYLKGFCPLDEKCLKKHVDTRKNQQETEVSASKKVPPMKPKRKSIGHTPMTPLEKKKPRTRYFDEQVVVYENHEQIVAHNNIANNSAPMHEEEEISMEKVDENDTVSAVDQVQSFNHQQDHSFEMKRQRLLRKVDLVKQGWSGVGAVQDNNSNTTSDQEPKTKACGAPPLVELDDSGPYEEIDEDDYEDHQVANTRPPLGRLPSYISLSSSASNANMSTTTSSQFVVENQVEEPDEEFEERLI